MALRNDLDRFHLVMDVIDRVPGLGSHAAALRQRMEDERVRAATYARTNGIDPEEISGWTWPPTDLVAHPRPERWLQLAEGERDRGRAARAAGRSGGRLGLRCDEGDRPTKDSHASIGPVS